jgi:hypothetical protein
MGYVYNHQKSNRWLVICQELIFSYLDKIKGEKRCKMGIGIYQNHWMSF